MKVTTVHMPGMFKIKDDVLRHDAGSGVAPYTPMPYQLGDVCEKCWLTVEVPGSDDGPMESDWLTHEAAVYPVGGFGCPHGALS